MPFTSPLTIPTVAIDELPLVHVPVVLASVRFVVSPTHTCSVPVMTGGAGVTVTIVVAVQPVPAVNVIVAVPPATPVTIPEPVPTVAMVVFAVFHVPGDEASLRVMLDNGQTNDVPEMAGGNGFTVTMAIVVQPVPNVYVIFAVPAATPLARPVPGTIVATLVLPLVQVPPPASVSCVFDDTQRFNEPDIGLGNGLTVTGVLVVQPVEVSLNEIVDVPVDTPVTTPLPETTVATLVLVLVHVPAPDASLRPVVKPRHAKGLPDMLAGAGKTVTVVVAVLPAPAV